MVCVLPNESVTVTVTTAPTSPEPVMVGVLSFPVPRSFTINVGAVVSTVPLCVEVVVLPDASTTVTSTV